MPLSRDGKTSHYTKSRRWRYVKAKDEQSSDFLFGFVLFWTKARACLHMNDTPFYQLIDFLNHYNNEPLASGPLSKIPLSQLQSLFSQYPAQRLGSDIMTHSML